MADGSIIIDTKIDNTGAKKGIRNLRAEATKLAQQYKKAGMDSSSAWEKAWNEIQRDSQSGSSKVKNDINSIQGIAKKCATIVGGLFLLKKVKEYSSEIVKVGIGYNAMAEQSQVAWTTILGSQDKAVKMMKDIENYAAKTPFSKMGVDQMAKQLTNAGYKGQALFDQLTKFGNMGSAFGIQEDSLKEMVRQYAQVQQAQVAYTEDLNILQDRGIPIYKALGEVMGVPVSQVKKLASEGKVTADVYNKAIDSIANNTKGAMENQSETFSGMISTLKDNLSILAGVISKPIFEKFKNSLQDIMPKLENFVDLVSANGLGSAISETFPKLKPLVDVFENIGSILTEIVIPAITDFGNWVLDHLDPISLLASAVGGVVLAFKAMSIISGIVSFIQGLAAVFGLLEVATLGEAAAQWAANLAFLACPLTWIVIAIGALVGAFIYLWNTSDGFRNFWIEMWENIKNFCISCWNGIINFFTITIPGWIESIKQWFIGLPAWFGQLWTNVKTWFVNKWNEIWNYLITNIPKWIDNIFKWFNELPGKIGFAIGQVLGKIIKWGLDTWNYLVTNVPKWISGIIKWFSELPGKVWSWLSNTVSKVIAWGTNMSNKAREVASKFISSVIARIKELPGKVWSWLSNTVSKVISWGSNLSNRGKEAAHKLVTAVVDTVKSIPGKMVEIGKNIVQGVWNGITGAAGWFKDKVSDFFGGIVDGAKSVLGIHSPSREMRDKVGKWILPGVSVGIDKSMPELQENVKTKMKDLTSTMKAKVQFESSSVGKTILSNNDCINFKSVSSDNSSNSREGDIFIVKNYLDSEKICETTYKFTDNSLAIANRKRR